MKKIIILTIILSGIFSSCQKESLDAPYAQLRGKFTWVGNTTRDCELCSAYYITNNSGEFKAEIEFDESGKVKFYIDDEILEEKRFKIIKEEFFTNESNFSVHIKVDVSKKNLDIDDNLTLTLINSDTLRIDKYPYNGYKSSNRIILSNYFLREN